MVWIKKGSLILARIAALAVCLLFLACPPQDTTRQGQSQTEEESILAQRRQIDQLLQEGKQPEAIQRYQSLVEKQPDSSKYFYLYGYALKDLEKKWKSFDQCLRLDPKQFWCMVGRGQVYGHWGVFDRAQADFEGAQKERSAALEPLVGLADIAARRKRNADAIKLYNDVLAKQSDHPEATLGLAVIYEREKNFPQAITWFRKVLDKQPQHFDSLQTLGSIYYNQTRQYPEAAEMFERAIQIRPRSYQLHVFLADSYEKQNQEDKAFTVYEKIGKFPEAHFSALYRLAALKLKRGDTEGGMETLKSVLQQRNDHEETLVALGRLHLQKKDAKAAAPLLWRALRQNNQNIECRLLLADALRQTDDLAGSLRQYEEILRLDSQQQTARAHLRSLLRTLGLSEQTYQGRSTPAVLERASADVQKCYRSRLKKVTGLRGQLDLKLIVDPPGRVESVSFSDEGENLRDPLIIACAQWTFRRVVLPNVSRRILVRYSLKFRP